MNNEFENEYTSEEETEKIEFENDFEESEPEEETYAPEFTVTRRPKKKNKLIKVVALSLVAGIVAGSAFGLANSLVTKFTYSNINIGTTKLEVAKDSDKKEISDIAAITEACMPAVVAITNRSVSDVMTFFGKYSQESTSSGSGIIIGKNDSELLIVTNYHVVANSKELSVIFSSVEKKLEMQADPNQAMAENSESIPSAIVKGYNQDKDLAVIAVSLKDIPAEVLGEIKVAVIGDSSAIKAGDRVVAIGNALGYGQSVTTGIVSAVNRRITGETNDGTIDNTFIQTDAAINFGNSGGALLNMYGEVIGINSAKISASGVEGMGYAIPITDVENIIDELMVKKTRKVVDENKQGFLGITGRDVSSAVSESFGIPMGVYVDSVTKGLGAEKAGIKKGYIICAFDGYTITSIAQLQDRLTYYSAGEEVDVLVKIPSGENGYKEKIIKVKLSNKSKNIDKVE